MKVLFAVNREEISSQIVKKYQKEYKEIISFKNVYYFNAIIKELQRDKTYDRIIISEDLEPFANNNYDAIDKFIFDKLDNISDEATGTDGDIPIILICTERRNKTDAILVKLFGIGIYNALLGNDRSINNLCQLINKPRSKREAKIYYKIESNEVNYQSEDENSVSETEIQNIINYYKRLGKNEEKYVESFDKIASQYNDKQLKIIIKFLPLNVKAVLEANSEKYQSLIAFSGETSAIKKQTQIKKQGLEIGFLDQKNKNKLSRPVIVPKAVNMQAARKLNTKKEQPISEEYEPEELNNFDFDNEYINQPMESINNRVDFDFDDEDEKESNVNLEEENNKIPEMNYQRNLTSRKTTNLDVTDNYSDEEEEDTIKQEIVQPKRGRGRPKKQVENVEVNIDKPKRGRGRPRKQVPINELESFNTLDKQNNRQTDEVDEDFEMPGFNAFNNNEDNENEDTVLPGFDEIDTNQDDNDETTVLPGFDEFENSEFESLDNFETSDSIPTIKSNPNLSRKQFNEEIKNKNINEWDNSDYELNNTYKKEQINNRKTGLSNSNINNYNKIDNSIQAKNRIESNLGQVNQKNTDFDSFNTQNYSNNKQLSQSLNSYSNANNYSMNNLSKDRKTVIFVGTTKNGTSFLVNNLGKCLSDMGIKTAILDLTQNKNSYYVYTNNEEKLRNIAYESIKKLNSGIVNGIDVDRNLSVFTALPGDNIDLNNAEGIISTLSNRFSVVLIDADFNTPVDFFALSQELYVVQTLDILTIQPMTAFLRDLKAKNILNPEKIKIVINKEIRVRGLTSKAIIGGLAFYNDPAMSFMTELFNKETVKYCTIPFEDEVYSKYLEAMLDCQITLSGYSKNFMVKLKELANMVYPLLNSNNRSSLGNYSNAKFSSDINKTLQQMKNKY